MRKREENVFWRLLRRLKRLGGVRRWEIASEKMGVARELRELGKRHYDAKRVA